MSASKRRRKASHEPVKGPTRTIQPAAAEEGFCVVGIGASAGGLEAFTALLKALPSNLGMGFVFVPHLDPHRESAFSEILARSTRMPVDQAEDGMQVERDHVYVIPPNREMTISGCRLFTAAREDSRTVNTTIDIFLRSLAADQGHNAIGVVLSGTASDGTLGLTAIKGEGGITFAQEPASAKYDGMPSSAIASQCVDFILPPEKIAAELARISRHPYVAGPGLDPSDGDGKNPETYMSQVFRLLRRATKVDFSEYKPPTIGRRVQRRMALHKIVKIGEYVALLHRDRAEVEALYQDLLINVTCFFRNPEAFETLKHQVYPAILAARGSSTAPIRIWVPGCSTGEETYSHAMSLMEFLGDERVEVPIQIFGTDLSEAAVQRARAGFYRENIEADVTPIRLRRFFHKADGGYQISKTIRDLCIFSTQNVFSDPPFSRMDLVSCRNVMIYLSQTLQKRVIPIFHYALNPTGFLMIGSTEGLLGAGSELFEMTDKKQKIYRKKLVTTPVTFGFSMGRLQPDGEGAESSQAIKTPDAVKPPVELQREADRLLLTRYAPPAVVVNDHLEIIQTRGRTGPFLELPAGRATLNLLKMARPGLLFELQGAIDKARKTGLEVQRRNVRVEDDGNSGEATVRIIPFKTPLQEQFSFLVVFEEQPSAGSDRAGEILLPPEPLTEAEQSDRDKQIAQLKQELAATKEYLQSINETQEATNEELQSANEEIQSGNEELQSTNEELQTSKEELESANEELHTLNEEMQHRNELLNQLNNDLTNLLNSVNIPMVMVAADLSVRRFTPLASTVLGLRASDVGMPLPRLKLKIDVSNLEQMMLDVMQRVQASQTSVQANDGIRCSLRIAPYRTLDNRIDGVVLSVLNKANYESTSRAKAAKSKSARTPDKKKPKTTAARKRRP